MEECDIMNNENSFYIGQVKKEGELMANDNQLIMKSISFDNNQININNEYENFYDWFGYNCNTDKTIVHKNKLKYLYKSYDNLASRIETELNAINYDKELKTIDKNNKIKKKYAQYLEKTKSEYDNITDISEKNYQYYDELSSWYAIKLEITKKITKNLFKKAIVELYNEQNNNSIDRYLKFIKEQDNQCTTKEIYVNIIVK